MMVPLMSVGVPGACMSRIDPFTVSECSSMHCATMVSCASVMLFTLLQLHSVARVLGQVVGVNSCARIWIFIRVSTY